MTCPTAGPLNAMMTLGATLAHRNNGLHIYDEFLLCLTIYLITVFTVHVDLATQTMDLSSVLAQQLSLG